MDLSVLLIVLAVIGIALFIALSKKEKEQSSTNAFEHTPNKERPRACAPLTKHEQLMFFRLQEALPKLIVLSQVSFGALLTAQARGVRNTFDRKRADFVICDKSFKVLAVVELDDSSHDGREEQDANRDKLLTDAGYRVLRYRSIPDVEQVAGDFK